jgi:ribosomal protein S18 acetylase RimI-like enzyme
VYLPVVDSDVPVIAQLMNRAYRGPGGSSGWSTEEAYLAGERNTETLLRADVKAKPSAFLLKWKNEPAKRIVGCVWLEPIGENTWYLGSLAIDPEQQNGGLGRTMLAAAEEWARERGAKRMRLTAINVREALIAWDVRRGYAKTGAAEPFPYGDDRSGRPTQCFKLRGFGETALGGSRPVPAPRHSDLTMTGVSYERRTLWPPACFSDSDDAERRWFAP